MVYDWTLKTAATDEPVTPEEVADHLRIASTDPLFMTYASAARQWVEAYTERALVTQTWQLSLDGLYRQIWLPRSAPLQSVTHLKYYDSANVLQTWAASNYRLAAFHEPALLEIVDDAVLPSTYLRADAVQIEYVTGYASGACPDPLRAAVLLLTAHFYENREAVLVGAVSKPLEFALEALCAPYRVFGRPPCP